jgi:hypothetical protein
VAGEKFGARKSDRRRGVAKGRVERLSSSSLSLSLDAERESSPNWWKGQLHNLLDSRDTCSTAGRTYIEATHCCCLNSMYGSGDELRVQYALLLPEVQIKLSISFGT